ncbi:MAG: hypothetical protein J6C23_05825 [Clostridia bacterium]|nr:hypothetical protein [Clostridia bacterium]
MLELDENKSLNGIFKDEDFETEDEFSVEEGLDSALNEIAGLKETLAMGVTKSEPYSPTRDGYKRTESRTVEYKQPEYVPQHEYVKQPEYTVQPVQTVPTVSADALLKVKEELAQVKSTLTVLAKNSSSKDIELIKNGLGKAEEAFIELKSKLESAPENTYNDTFVTSVIHQLVKIKKLIGSDNIAEVQLNNELNELYLLEQKATRYVENGNIPYERKFGAIDDLVQRLKEAYNYDVAPLVDKANILIGKLSSQALTKESLTALATYLNQGKETRMSTTYVKELETYLSLAEKASLTTAEKASGMLDDIVSRKNAICHKKRAETEALHAEYVKNCNALQTETDKDSVTFLRNKTNSILKELTKLSIGDVYVFDKIEIQKDFKVLKQPSNKSIYETVNELKSIISSGGLTSADNSGMGIASDISYIKEKLDIIQSGKINSVSESGAQQGGAVVSGTLTLESIVGQLDRLFDDVKNVADALEVNVLDNLAIINDNINIIKESVDRAVDRIMTVVNSLETIHEIKEIVSFRYNDENLSANSSAIASQLEKQNEIMTAMFENMQKMQSRMDEMGANLETVRSENAELKKVVEKVFETTEDTEASFETVKSVISELKGDVEAITENVAQNAEADDNDLDAILDRIDEAIADKSEKKE